MSLFVGFLIIVGLLFWVIKLNPLGIILCSLFAYFLINMGNTPQTEIGWTMFAVMLVGIVINLIFYHKRNHE